MSGVLIAFEGGEATGKSTQAALLARRLGAVLTREPGGTPVGERVRSLVLDPALPVVPRAEALLMAAARAQHVDEVIRPALEAGRHVVTDRFIGSSLAYQGVARRLGVDEVRSLSRFAAAGLDATVVVLLDLAPEVAASRLSGVPDRMEREGPGFHAEVAAAFRALAAADPARWHVVDASGSVADVEAAIWSAVRPAID